jgi:hypothetical protein
VVVAIGEARGSALSMPSIVPFLDAATMTWGA